MPSLIESRYACLYTQQDLDRILGSNDPLGRTIDTFGFTEAMISPLNTSGFEAIQVGVPRPFNSPSESNKRLTTYFRVPECKPVIQGEPDVCVVGDADKDDYTVQEVYVENYHHIKISLDRQTYQQACQGLSDVLAYKVIDAVNQLRKAENTYFVETFYADLDNYFNGQASTAGSPTEQALKLFDKVGRPNGMGLFKMKEEYSRKGYADVTPIMVGGTGVNAWSVASNLFVGNQDGFDINRIPFNIGIFLDYTVDTVAQGIAGDLLKRGASWIPSHIQRLLWHKYAEGSEFRVNQPSITKTTLNVNGELWDYSVNDDGCNDYVVATVGRGYDMWVAPSEAFGATDCVAQETLLNYLLDCNELDCEDTIFAGSPIVP